MIPQVKFELRSYFRSSSWVMPLLAYLVFLVSLYSVEPVEPVSACMSSGLVCFLILVWAGMGIQTRNHFILDQILYLKEQSFVKYYWSKVIFYMGLAVMGATLGSCYPLLVNGLNGGTLFEGDFGMEQVGNYFLILSGCGICGIILGTFFSPEILKNRKHALLLTALLAVLTICQSGIAAQFPICRWGLWILPPFVLLQRIYIGADGLVWEKSLRIWGILIAYAIVCQLIRMWLCNRVRWNKL